jgi:tRNA nucleotidyltransferase/poly(A) polymerase
MIVNWRCAKRGAPTEKRPSIIPLMSAPFAPDAFCARLSEVLQRLSSPAYVVGGAVRDAWLGRPPSAHKPVNLDLAVPRDALVLGRRLADAVGGAYVPLHEEEAGTARVIVTVDGARVEVDLSDFRGASLQDDLARRDFTVNAMAVPLAAWCGPEWKAAVIDPLGGREDLARRRLRACYAGTFLDDPIRVLRAFRFGAQLEAELDPSMAPLLREAGPRLSSASGERVREELLATFQTERAGWACRQLEELQLLDVLFPELAPGRGIDQGGYHHLTVLNHELETVAQCDRMLADFAEFSPDLRAPMAEYCAATPVEGRTRKALIKLAGLYHDVGKPATRRVEADGDIWFIGHEQFGEGMMEAVVNRLKLSNREGDLVRKLVLYHLRPGHLSREPQLTRRAIFRFFRDLEEDGPACLFVWWADRLSTRGPISRVDQIDQQRARLEELFRAYFFKAEEVVSPRPVIDGTTLMRALGLTPGPTVGRLLRAVQEAQAEGRVGSAEDALTLARELLVDGSGA